MKRIFLVMLLISVSLLFSTNIYVDINHTGLENGTEENPYNSIQEAINHYNFYINDYIIVAEGVYNEDLDFSVIENNSQSPNVIQIKSRYLLDSDNSLIEQTVLRSSSNISVLKTFDLLANIAGFTINGNGLNAIESGDEGSIVISDCRIIESDIGLQCINGEVQNTIFSNNNQAVSYIPNGASTRIWVIISHSLFLDNTFAIQNVWSPVICWNSTFVDNYLAISGTDDDSFKNCLFFQNNTNIQGTPIIEYCLVEGGYSNGTNIIDYNPLFKDPANNDYHLADNSPCIDAGDPSSTLDDDATIADIGCYPVDQTLLNDADNGITFRMEEKWEWISFPRLIRNSPGTQVVGSVLGNNLGDPGIAPYAIQIVNKTGNLDDIATYSAINYWQPDYYEISSVRGYKVNMAENADEIYSGIGAIESPDTELTLQGYNTESWLGYFLPETQNIFDALTEVLDDIDMIQTKDWCLVKVWNGTENEWKWKGGSGVLNPTISYGEMVAVNYRGREATTFRWNNPNAATQAFVREETNYYTYEEKADYVPIFVELETTRNNLPDEIAVMVDGECKGAAVVAGETVQINAYILDEPVRSEGTEIDFAFFYGRKNAEKFRDDYVVFNNSSNGYEQRKLSIGEGKRYQQVSFRLEDEEAANDPYIATRISNYPNPFNPTTTINFSIPETGKVELAIYNIRGQKVKSLINESIDSGQHSVVWTGRDDHGNTVTSGVYFCKLKTKTVTKSQKLLLLK